MSAAPGPSIAAVVPVALTPGASEIAHGLAVGAALEGRPAAVLLPSRTASPRASALSSESARGLEAAARVAGLEAAARGRLVVARATPEPAGEETFDLLASLRHGPLADVDGAAVFAVLDATDLNRVCALERPPIDAAALVCRIPAQRSVAGLAIGELGERGVTPRLAIHRLGRLAARRVRSGLEPGGSTGTWFRRLARGLLDDRGQALVLGIGLALTIVVVALALAIWGSSLNAAARTQRAADLTAVTAVRSLRDDLPAMLAPRALDGGRPNPAHMTRAVAARRAREHAIGVATRNGLPARSVRIAIEPGPAPLRARVEVRGELEAMPAAAGRVAVRAVAVAAASPPSADPQPAVATGGGYSGPLAYRAGKPMRPDVASAYDRMAAAAGRSGHVLHVTSGYRSDVEQAALFAANPDPRWVAPPGQSLHRCATELDLGPTTAYPWLAANARRFGFLRRYPWEPWHFGYVEGPAPCSAEGEAGGTTGSRRSGGREPRPRAVPGYVPAAYRATIAREAAANGVSAALLAAQLMAESNFNPHAVSPAGARGIAQFMPATAAEWGLGDPFDPHASIAAQARFMAHLISSFGRTDLALAAYNAGPGAVAACGCVPAYAETVAYVAKIVALAGASGDTVSPVEVRLVSSAEWPAPATGAG